MDKHAASNSMWCERARRTSKGEKYGRTEWMNECEHTPDDDVDFFSLSLASVFLLFFCARLHPIGRLELSVLFSHLLWCLNKNENGDAFCPFFFFYSRFFPNSCLHIKATIFFVWFLSFICMHWRITLELIGDILRWFVRMKTRGKIDRSKKWRGGKYGIIIELNKNIFPRAVEVRFFSLSLPAHLLGEMKKRNEKRRADMLKWERESLEKKEYVRVSRQWSVDGMYNQIGESN